MYKLRGKISRIFTLINRKLADRYNKVDFVLDECHKRFRGGSITERLEQKVLIALTRPGDLGSVKLSKCSIIIDG